nr:hypothetical protein [uncultured Undibacterium sp.]
MTLPRPDEFTHHHKWLQRAFERQPDEIGAATLQLWEHLARELISIIGEAGFESLYSRCVYLLKEDYPWLQLRLSSSQADTRFDELRSQLDQQELALAERASRMLLDTFIRLLGGLIGAGLTQNILQVAWGSILPDAESKVEPDSDDPRGDP